MMKRILQLSSLLVFCGSMAMTSPGAFAQGEITGTVYQITPNDVYVEMPDHTAVRVKNDTAVFMRHGAPVDVTDLRRGNGVVVQYLPKATVTTTTYRLNELPPLPRERVTVTRDTEIDGHTVHHYWADGYWHTNQ